MKTLKMSLENIQGKMSRNEMRNIMAGSGGFICSCSGVGNNGTLAWASNYSSTMSIIDAINANCGSVGGSCSAA